MEQLIIDDARMELLLAYMRRGNATLEQLFDMLVELWESWQQ